MSAIDGFVIEPKPAAHFGAPRQPTKGDIGAILLAS
jgi:hypothetical protein